MKKRILSLFLALVLLFSTVALLASCKKKEEASAVVDFSEYTTIVYNQNASDSMVAELHSFAAALKALTGKDYKLVEENSKGEVDTDDKEILVGATKRVESEAALEKISGVGYGYTKIDNKIVIAGSSNLLAREALALFTENYLGSGAETSDVTIEEKIVSDVDMLRVTSSFTVVLAKGYSTDNSSVAWGDPAHEKDYPLEVAESIKLKVQDVLGTAPAIKTDNLTATSYEILLGSTKRNESLEFLSGLDVMDYGIYVKNNKIVVGSYNDTTLALVSALFKDALADAKYKKDGNNIYAFPVGYKCVRTGNSNWVTDFPRPAGLQLSGAIDVYDGSLQYLYTGNGVSDTAFNSYCALLENNGYTVLVPKNTIENSMFVTYVNTAKKTTVYVAYNAMKNASAQGVSDYEKALRVIVASTDSVNLPTAELLNANPTYTKVTDTRITNVILGGGNCYVMMLEDGSFIVFDGGDGTSAGVPARIWGVLSSMYLDVFGKNASSTNKIHIRAWYLSHGHGDHYYNMYSFFKNSTYNTKVTLDYLITNFPSDAETHNTIDINTSVRDGFFAEISNLMGGHPKYVKVHTGQKLYFCNVEMEVLYTHEDLFPTSLQYFNNTGVAARFTIRNKDSSTAKTNWLYLGDIQTRASKWMRAMYGSYLATDMVQVSHHGATGVEWEFYQLTQAKVLWWPTPLTDFVDIVVSGNAVSKNLIKNLASVKYIVLGDGHNSTLVMTKSFDPTNIQVDTSGDNLNGFYEAFPRDATPVIQDFDDYLRKK